MKYDIIKDCMIKGERKLIGEVVELDDSTAKTLMAIGRVVPHDESKVENRAVALETSTETTKKRGRPRKVDEDDVDGE